MIQKKYRVFVIVFSVIISICFVFSVISIIRFSKKTTFFSILLVGISVALFRYIQIAFYKNGYFSGKQAQSFFEECSAQGIKQIQPNNFEAAKTIYDETVANVYFEKSKKTITLLNTIYSCGKKQGGTK